MQQEISNVVVWSKKSMILKCVWITCFLGCLTSSELVFAQTDKKNLIDGIEQAIAIMDGLSPFDFVAVSEEVHSFQDDVVATGDYRFRFRSDLENKAITCAMDSKSIFDQTTGSPTTRFWQIRDNVLRSKAVEQAYRERLFENHESTNVAARIPSLAKSVYSCFPEFGSDYASFPPTLALILETSTDVQARADSESVSYVARFRGTNGDVFYKKWEFSAPEGLILEFREGHEPREGGFVDRFVQTFIWGEFLDRKVPIAIILDKAILREKSHATIKNFHELGSAKTESEFFWISVSEPLRPEPKADLATIAGIKQYIQDGLKDR